ncbi:HPP family protein [Paenibacillus selenitireducens]|uniref:HPP family protein n=1 Tax=Paenibacillus selenitireducens TaxID=1324314 RepID=A0A1T2XM72_9BACL|nr:HPP family protein [Paenibacillus selenitireducens]OPA80969.1 HPP family protein [Paenibacillus selenitireducens]
METKYVWHRFFSKMSGSGKSPLKVSSKTALLGFIGGFIAIGMLAFLTDLTSAVWLMAPFGASCVLAFGVWDAPLSQPRNIIGGHMISAAVGLLLFHLFGNAFWVIALGVGLAIAFMHITRTTHPPAGANPIVVIMAGSPWTFLINPVLIGSLVIVVIALVVNNLDEQRQYPKFWV